MTLVRIRRVFVLAGTSLGFAGAVYACSLNPQPLPPGDTADGGGTNNPVVGEGDASFGGGADSGGLLGADGATGANPPDGSYDGGGVPAPPEGGDASDGGDGETDAPADAPEGAPADAPTDGEESGG